MKKILLLSAVLLLAACSTVDLKPTTCYQKAAIAEVSVSLAYDKLLMGVTTGAIDNDKAEDIYTILRITNMLLDDATTACSTNPMLAEDYIIQALTSLNKALLYIGDN